MDARRLMIKMIQVEARKRGTCEQLLFEPWITQIPAKHSKSVMLKTK